MKKTKNKVLVIGAGPVGCTVSNILAKENFEITIIDQRNHIAGNCYDEINKKGILVHKYGPHYFRTNKKMIVNYLSNYTKWIKGNYFVRSVYKKKHYDFPININTLQKFFKRKFTKTEAKNFLKKKSIKKKNIDNFESYLISKMGQDLYEAFYKNYTIKQWNIDPRKLSVKVAKRIPIYFDKTRSYFKSKFMIMPKNGFTKMFYNMTNSQNIFIRLNTKYKQSMKKKFDIIIYTGPVDLFFNYKFGKLEWRSLDFKFITKKKTFLQDQVQVNYPNNYKYTRTVEYKHITKQKNKYTTISKEYPKSAGEPYYPVDTKRNNLTYKKYLNEIKKLEKRNIFFAGRLAEYTYINTDEAIYKGILLAKKIKNIYYNKR